MKESIDTQQNKLIKQLQENQLALTAGFEGNRKAITTGFDKMDEVKSKKWDLSQLPGYEEIEYPEEEPEEEPEEDREIIEKIKDLQNLLLKKNVLMAKTIAESQEKYQDGNFNDANRLLKEADNQRESIESLQRKIRRLHLYLGEDEDEDEEEESVEKPKSVAYFKFEDFDKGLNYKEARDILKEFGINRLPSKYEDESIEKINKKLEKVREKLNIIKKKLKDSAIAKFNIKEGFETVSPLKKRPQPKTLDLIEKHDTLRRFIFNLNNLKMLKEKTGKGIIHFNNPQQLVNRLELLAGSILAGNNGVKQEFSQIAHLLHQLKVISKKTLNDLLKKYILFK